MSVDKLAENTAKKILQSLNLDMDKQADIAKLIEPALVTILKDTRAGCVEAVNICCSADQDLAHKISVEVRQKEQLLIAQLTSMR